MINMTWSATAAYYAHYLRVMNRLREDVFKAFTDVYSLCVRMHLIDYLWTMHVCKTSLQVQIKRN